MTKQGHLDSINKRLKFFIENHLQSNPRQFALSLDSVSPGVISNIVGNRLNKPSNTLLTKIKYKYPELNLEWLIMGGDVDMLVKEYEYKNLVKTDKTMKTMKNPQEEVPFPADSKNKEALKKYEKKIMTPIIKRIRDLRLEARYTNDDMAKFLGMTITGYASIEQGLVYFSVPKLIRMSKVFKKSYKYMLDGVDEDSIPVSPKEMAEKDKEISQLKKEISLLEKNIALLEQLSKKK
jgi:transcriptional regulator with XRE-family HTH domain